MQTNDITQDVTENVTTVFQQLAQRGAQAVATKILFAALLFAVCLVVMRVLLALLDRVISKTKIERSLHTFIKSTVKIILWFITILIVADSLNIPITSLIAVLSVAGLAISLAIQGTLSNLAGGIMLLVSKPFKVGDFIEAGGVSGTVADIAMVYTQINTIDNKLISIPNSEISEAKIVNYTTQEKRRVDLTFSASYDAPQALVRSVIRKVIEAHPMTEMTPEPFVRVSEYQDSAINYLVRVWCATEDYWTLYYDLLEQVKDAFDQNGIEMTYQHLNVHMIDK